MKKFINVSRIFLLCAAVVACVVLTAPTKADAAELIKVEKPALDVTLTYDGTEQTISLPPSNYYTSETVKCTNAGVYTLTVRLNNKNVYCWDDMTTDDLKLEFEIKKAVFDVGNLTYEDETCVYDGKAHFIGIGGLPASASVLFNTVKSDPGVYESFARVDLGSNYENNIITVDGATLTVLAVDAGDENVVFSDNRGFNPAIAFSSGKGKASDFKYRLPAGDNMYYDFAPVATLNGERYDFGNGAFTYRVFVPTQYTGVKAYVNDNGKPKQVPIRWDSQYAIIDVSEMCEFAIVYTGSGEFSVPQLLWLEILLGVLITVECVVVIKQTLFIRKNK